MASKPPKPPKDNITVLKGKGGKSPTGKTGAPKFNIPVSLQVQSWLMLLEQTDEDQFAQRVIEHLMKLYDKVTDPIQQNSILSTVILTTEDERSRDWAGTKFLEKAKTAEFDDKLEFLAFVHVAEVGTSLLKDLAEQVDALMETHGPADFIVFMSDPETFFSPIVAEFMADLFLIHAQYMHGQYMIDYADLLLTRSEILTEDTAGKVAALIVHMTGDENGNKIIASNPELQELLDELTEEVSEEDVLAWENLIEEESNKPLPEKPTGKLVKFTAKQKKPTKETGKDASQDDEE